MPCVLMRVNWCETGRWRQGNKWIYSAAGTSEEESFLSGENRIAPELSDTVHKLPLPLRNMSSTDSRDLGRALCIITGASRGFGRTAAREMSRRMKPRSVLVLVARTGDDLRSLQAELAESEEGRAGLVAECVAADLGQAEGVESVVRASKERFCQDIDHIILVNNAASLGDVSRYTKSFTNMAEVNSYLSLNVSSCLCLTASILQAFPQRPGLRRTVINISSLCALKPFRSWGLYCTGKAARDMMFKVLAEEEPDLRVLNYSPGPLDTDMLTEARTRTVDPTLRKSFTDMFAQGQVLTCEQSCAKLMKLLLDDSYTSGDHVDIYDV
ncbi:sepiapterin reductase a [Seriola aureovittata]|uniref:Sepiapterin reductase n=2 Tax=Seriola lalandi dorsalis TaxID=1841481 RepID=A0A3B4YIP7_SERLL|nr:sepiapterin reductase a [Seriola aureovittata]